MLKQNGMFIGKIPWTMKKDRELALAAVSQNGLALSFLRNEFADDEEIVLAALKQSLGAFEFIGAKISKLLPQLLINHLEGK